MTDGRLKLGIVIVNYNSRDDLDRCLDSITSFPPSAPYQVVVVDNASSEPGLEEVSRRYPQFDWVFSRENTGYSRGCNLGMARVEADYHLVMNPDIVVKPGALDRLLEFADANPRAGIVGPQLLNPDGSIQESCRRFYTFKTLLLRRTFLGKIFPDSETVRLHLMQDFDHRSSRPVDWMLGGCMLVRDAALDRTGPMDERFFLYFEDVDWCYRMWQAGYEVVYTPDARFIHRHRRESSQKRFGRSFWAHLGSLISFYEKWGAMVWLLKKWREPLLVFLLWALDLAGLAAAFGMAYGLRSAAGSFFAEPLYPFAEYRPVLWFSLLLATATFLLTGRYRSGWLRRPPDPGAHLQQVGVVAVLLLAATYLGHLDVVSRAVLLAFIPLMAVTTAVGGRLLHRLLRRLERGNLVLERTLLCGPPQRIAAWLAGAADASAQGVDVAGYVADPDSPGGSLPALGAGTVPWLGPGERLLEVVRRYRISQVVFWERPNSGDRQWQRIAGLRRLRVRLRWQLEDVWLLAAGTRAELFGGEPGAVQEVGGRAALHVLLSRLTAVTAGLLLGALGWLPWLWLKIFRFHGGTVAPVTASDRWGHRAPLRLAVDRRGRVMPLPCQWALAVPLLTGRLALTGPRPRAGEDFAGPETGDEILEFWRSRPRTPGLTGWGEDWDEAADGRPGRPGALQRIMNRLGRLWRDPGGFGYIHTDPAGAPARDPIPPDGNEAAS